MGFKPNGLAKVWKVENKGNYSVVNLSTAKKNKQTGNYENDFSENFVSFVGDAHKKISEMTIPEKGGLDIKLINFDVTTKIIEKNGNKNKYYNFAVFDFAKWEWDNSKSPTKTPSQTGSTKTESVTPAVDMVDIASDDLPF